MQNIRFFIPAFTISIFLFSFTPAAWTQQTAGRITLKQLQAIYQQANDTTYVVNFWATWCGPCVMEMPALLQFHQERKNSKIRLLLISLDQLKYEKQVNHFIAKNKIEAPVYILDAGKGFDWLPQVDPGWQGSIPATLIINNNNKKRLFHEAPLQPGQLDYLLKKSGLD